jgi:outer membrane protein OmpA-like peptidoglycan-associated protein
MKKVVFLFLAVFTVQFLFAQAEDAEGCKDHPMFTRMPNFKLYQCQENFASLELYLGEEKKEEHEGTRTHLKYLFNNQENTVKPPSWLQVRRNYENAIIKAGGKKLFSDPTYANFKFSQDGKDIWVQLQMTSGEELAVEEYWVDILQSEAMKQEIQSTAMYKEISEKGFIALYINFETGKSDVKAESQPIIDQMVTMLKEAPSLKISIEGHTDNVGTPAANKILSENRAKAVMNALIAKGIDKSRLSSKGWGQEKPMADNKTDEGKAKNRRVEIVKI